MPKFLTSATFSATAGDAQISGGFDVSKLFGYNQKYIKINSVNIAYSPDSDGLSVDLNNCCLYSEPVGLGQMNDIFPGQPSPFNVPIVKGTKLRGPITNVYLQVPLNFVAGAAHDYSFMLMIDYDNSD